MKKMIYFMFGWVLGVYVLNLLVFQLFLKFIKNENAVAILCTCIVCVFTVVLGCAIGNKK